MFDSYEIDSSLLDSEELDWEPQYRCPNCDNLFDGYYCPYCGYKN